MPGKLKPVQVLTLFAVPAAIILGSVAALATRAGHDHDHEPATTSAPAPGSDAGEPARVLPDAAEPAGSAPAPVAAQPEPAARPVSYPRQWAEGAPQRRKAVGVLEGRPAPELDVKNWLNSQPLKLEDLKGKIVLIEFFSPDCPHCATIAPRVNKLYNDLKKHGLVVIGVSKESPDEMFARFIDSHNVDYPVCMDNGRNTMKAFKADGTPDFYLIDDEGHVRVADLSNRFHGDAAVALVNELRKKKR